MNLLSFTLKVLLMGPKFQSHKRQILAQNDVFWAAPCNSIVSIVHMGNSHERNFGVHSGSLVSCSMGRMGQEWVKNGSMGQESLSALIFADGSTWKFKKIFLFLSSFVFIAARCYAYAHGPCRREVSVRPSVTFETSKHRPLQFFFHRRVATHSSFSIPNVMTIFPMGTLLECRWGRQKMRFSTHIWLHRVSSTIRRTVAIWWHSSLVSGVVCCSRERSTKCLWQELRLNVTPKTTEQHLIVYAVINLIILMPQ